MDKVIFKIDNKFEDYFTIYPELNKSVLSINRWTKYVLALFLLLLIITVTMSITPNHSKEEFGYTTTTTVVILLIIVGIVIESASKKNVVTTSVTHLVAKGSAQVTIDLVGIEMKYSKEIKLIEWAKNSGQLFLENSYMMVTDNVGNMVAIIPKGVITVDKWFEIQELTISIMKLEVIKRYGLNV